MTKQMKIMIAYDGSSSADVAIDDLRLAGLSREVEALIVSVADLFQNTPPISEFDLLSLASRRVEAVVERTKTYRKRAINEAEDLAVNAANRLRSQFPEWRVKSLVLQGTPTDELLQKAAQWHPDLIVAGSQGRSALRCFFLGSVSALISAEAKCSVRVGRGRNEKSFDSTTRILIGVDHSREAEYAIRAVARRFWTLGTEVRLVSIDDGVSPKRVSAVLPYAARMFEWAEDELTATGLQVSIDIKKGDPKSILLEEARNWKADSIFVAADWMKESRANSKLSKVANALVKNAPCSVEVAR